MEQEQAAHKSESDRQQLQYHNKLLKEEMEQLESRYRESMTKIEKKEALFEWRRQRMALTSERKAVLDKEWAVVPVPASETDSAEFHSARGSDDELVQESMLLDAPYHHVSDNTHIEMDRESDGSFESAIGKQTPLISNIDFNLPDESIDFGAVKPKIMSNDAQSHMQQEPSQVASENLKLPEVREILGDGNDGEEFFIPQDKPKEDRNDQTDTETLPMQYLKPKLSVQSNATSQVDVLDIVNALEGLESVCLPLTETFQKSIIGLWHTQLRLISNSNVCALFSPNGQEDANDLRFHLEIINSFYMFGSGQFASLVVDALFKSNSHGVALNSRLSNRAMINVSNLLGDVFTDIRDSKGARIERAETFVSLDVNSKLDGMVL